MLCTSSTSITITTNFCESILAALQKPNVHTLLVNAGTLMVGVERDENDEHFLHPNTRDTRDSPTNLEDGDFEIIAPILAGHTSLKRLDLTSYKFGDPAAKALGIALGTNSVLTSLNLSSNEISEEGIIALSAAFRINTGLVSVILDGNKMTKKSFEPILNALKFNSSITYLSLENTLHNVFRISKLASCLAKNTTLREMLFNEHLFSNISRDEIKTLEESLLNNPSLTRLFKEKKVVSFLQVNANFNPILNILERNVHNSARRSLTLFQALWIEWKRTIVLSTH